MTPDQSAEDVRPISWFVCPYCGAGRHEPCCTASGQVYPMGSYHGDRKQRAKRHNDGTGSASDG